MRIAFFILLIIHGLIHLIGFIKAFELLNHKSLPISVSKPGGIVWLLCTALFLLSAILFISKNSHWWVPVIPALALSQVLIIGSWQHAKMGTIANILIALVAVVAMAQARFAAEVAKEMNHIGTLGKGNPPSQINASEIESLPAPVRRWLANSGVSPDGHSGAITLYQNARIKLKPEQTGWYPATAKQVISADPPAFVWTVHMQMNPFMHVSGMDKLENGKGEMRMLLWSLIPVVNERGNERIDLGTMQRYLGEIVWFPSAALHPDISWKGVDEHTAVATLTSGSNSVEGTFEFGLDGLLKSFSTLRYMGGDATAPKRPWRIDVIENGEMNGLRIPTKLNATWTLDDGDWTWMELEITGREEDETFPKEM